MRDRDSAGRGLPQAAVVDVLHRPAAPEDRQADCQQLTAPRTQVQLPQARLEGQPHLAPRTVLYLTSSIPQNTLTRKRMLYETLSLH